MYDRMVAGVTSSCLGRRHPPNLALQRTRPAAAALASIHSLLGGPGR